MAAVKERVSSINSDVDAFNAELPGLIYVHSSARLDRLQADAEVVQALGVPQRQHRTSSGGAIDANPSGPADTYGRAVPSATATLAGVSTGPTAIAPRPRRRPGRPKGPDHLQSAEEIKKEWSHGARH